MFFDIHAHVYKYQYPASKDLMLFITPDELVETHDKLGIDRAVLLPLVSPEVYVPQSVGEIIDIANESNGRYIPFCNVDPRALTNTVDAPLGLLLEHYKKLGCKGIGEVLPNMSWDNPYMQNLLKHTEAVGFPLLFDMNATTDTGYGIYDDPGMPMLEKCLAKYPNLIFIGHGPAFWAEISELRDPSDRLSYPKYPIFKEGRVAKLMRMYPNLWLDLSAGSGGNAIKRDKDYAVSFLNEFCDRTMFGTDICYYGQEFSTGEYLIQLKNEKLISEATFKKIAYKNAYRLLGL